MRAPSLLLPALLCAGALQAQDPYQRAIQDLSAGRARPALAVLRPLADKGEARAQTLMGCACYLGAVPREGVDEALAWFRKAAAQGDPDAHSVLGFLLWDMEDGKPIPGSHAHVDVKEGLAHLRAAAEKGDTCAIATLHMVIGLGKAEGMAPAEVARWNAKAAELGIAFAQFDHGLDLMTGQGVAADPAAAMGWFRKAAFQGNGSAMSCLSMACVEGKGGKQDFVEGYAWCLLAQEAGETKLPMDLRSFETSLTKAQVAEGRRKAQELKARIKPPMDTKPLMEPRILVAVSPVGAGARP